MYIEPCPWCGEIPKVTERVFKGVAIDGQHFVRYDLTCGNCGDTLVSFNSEDHVIDEWNKAVRGYMHFKKLEPYHIKPEKSLTFHEEDDT